MWRDQLPISLTRLVTPRAVRVYAEGLGWQRVEGVNGKLAVFKDPASPLRQLIVAPKERIMQTSMALEDIKVPLPELLDSLAPGTRQRGNGPGDAR